MASVDAFEASSRIADALGGLSDSEMKRALRMALVLRPAMDENKRKITKVFGRGKKVTFR